MDCSGQSVLDSFTVIFADGTHNCRRGYLMAKHVRENRLLCALELKIMVKFEDRQ